MEIPRNLEMAMLHAIHTSSINGNERPISLCYVAVKAVLEEQDQGVYAEQLEHRASLAAHRGEVDEDEAYEHARDMEVLA